MRVAMRGAARDLEDMGVLRGGRPTKFFKLLAVRSAERFREYLIRRGQLQAFREALRREPLEAVLAYLLTVVLTIISVERRRRGLPDPLLFDMRYAEELGAALLRALREDEEFRRSVLRALASAVR
ncbi:MAG: hypothetical protein DRJ67_01460 [Thermoprotei archaeon]|nr:MAG: hypothetical protein DRJ67_01460 [Thermoprotei archaeon]